MNRSTRISTYFVAALVAVTLATSAFATPRSFVASTGSDANAATGCTRTNPCRNFAAALNITNAGGEIIALDSAGFGPVNVTKAITIEGTAPLIGVATGTIGVNVNAGANDLIVLRNITFSGAGNSSTTGVQVNSGRVFIEDCKFASLTTGLSVASSKAFVTRTTFATNTTAVKADGTGTDMQASPTVYGPTLVTLSEVEMVSNGTAMHMANPGRRNCPAGFSCYPSCSIGSPGCANLDNKISIFIRNTGISASELAANFVGNTTYMIGSGTGCTNPDPSGGAFCQGVGAYLPSTNPK